MLFFSVAHQYVIKDRIGVSEIFAPFRPKEQSFSQSPTTLAEEIPRDFGSLHKDLVIFEL